VIGALSIFYSLLGVSLFVPVVAGLYVRRAGTPEALAAIAGGVVVLMAVRLATDGRGFGAFSPPLLGLIGSAVAAAAAFVLRRPRPAL
jgi:SSS family solute:Na+ symporter